MVFNWYIVKQWLLNQNVFSHTNNTKCNYKEIRSSTKSLMHTAEMDIRYIQYLPTHVGIVTQIPSALHVAVLVLLFTPDIAWSLTHLYVTMSPSLIPVFVCVENGMFWGCPHVTVNNVMQFAKFSFQFIWHWSHNNTFNRKLFCRIPVFYNSLGPE